VSLLWRDLMEDTISVKSNDSAAVSEDFELVNRSITVCITQYTYYTSKGVIASSHP